MSASTKIDLYASWEPDEHLNYYFTSNRIISSSAPTRNFFCNFAESTDEFQERTLNELLLALRNVSTNAYELTKDDRQKVLKARTVTVGVRKESKEGEKMTDTGKESLTSSTLTSNFYGDGDRGESIMELVTELIIQNVHNFTIFNQLLQIFEGLLQFSSLDEGLMNRSIKAIVEQFYSNRVKVSNIFAATSLFKSIYNAKVLSQKDPRGMLVFHGERGLELSSMTSKPLSWVLGNGLTLCFWVNIENVKQGSELELPKLFTFYSQGYGGLESYLVDNKIYYRVLGSKYSEPQIGSNSVLLCELQPRKWNFICFQHEGHKTFNKSKLSFYINRGRPVSYSLDSPKISSGEKTKYSFFHRFYGRSSSICLLPSPCANQIVEDLAKNINSFERVKHPKALVLELQKGSLYQRSGWAHNSRYIFQRSTVMNFKQVLPLFYLLRFVNQEHKYPILNDLLELLVLFLRSSPQNQAEAERENYFKLISNLICEVPQDIFDESTIKVILHIKHTITDTQLLDQYFSDLLWPLLQSQIALARKEELLQIIKSNFTQNISHYAPVICLDEILNLLIAIQMHPAACCAKHFKVISKKFDNDLETPIAFGVVKPAHNSLFSLTQLAFQNPKINFAQQCYKLCRILTLKSSPCFTLDLMRLIKRLLSQKMNEKLSEPQAQKILKHYHEKQLYLIFVQVIENSFFAEIKAQSIKLIYSMLLKKCTHAEEALVSYHISKSLWKLNDIIEKDSAGRKCLSPQRSVQRHEVEPIRIEQTEKFAQVGPQAPQLSNRIKNNKSFDFTLVLENKIKPNKVFEGLQKTALHISGQESESIMNFDGSQGQLGQRSTTSARQGKFQSLRLGEIMEQEKAIEPEIDLASIPFPKKKAKKFGLSLDTEAINQMYTIGGEKGQQIIISENEEKSEFDKILRLAIKCVATMNAQGGNNSKVSYKIEEASLPQQRMLVRNNAPTVPLTTRNITGPKKMAFNLSLISEEEETGVGKVLSPVGAKKPSTRSPTSLSSDEETLYSLYNSLLECCLGMSFQTSMMSNCHIEVPSILSIFFKWIPQTDLETKFLNDLQILFEHQQNKEIIINSPQLYDFLLELVYKCLFFEGMSEKRIYMEKLEAFIKTVYSYIFKEDPAAQSKFLFVLDWAEANLNDYQHWSLFLTTRLTILLILEAFEEHLVMNVGNDQLIERNFQSFSYVLEKLRKLVPEHADLEVDSYERVKFKANFELPPSLTPYFKSDWADYLLYQKYLFLFKKFYCTDWYLWGLKNFQRSEQLLDYLMQTNVAQIAKESTYYMRNNFLPSLIEIHRAMVVEMKESRAKQVDEMGVEAIWQTLILIIFSETSKEKVLKSQRPEIVRSFLKSTKILALLQVQGIVEIAAMMSSLKHFLTITQNNNTDRPIVTSTQIVDDIINNYIPSCLLNIQKTIDIAEFKLHFSQVWIPEDTHFKKIRSSVYKLYEDSGRRSEEQETKFIELITQNNQEEIERYNAVELLVRASQRETANVFRKIWNQLRIFGSLWTHPKFKWQQDTLFNRSIYAYQRYHPNEFFRYKIAKHLSKFKARCFLKPRLIEPEIVHRQQKYEVKQDAVEHYNLEHAISLLGTSIEIGRSRIEWLLSKADSYVETIMKFLPVNIVNTLTVRSGQIGILNEKIVFVASVDVEPVSHLAIEQYRLKKDKSIFKVWPLELVKEVLRRRYANRRRAVQLHFIHGKSLFLDFPNEDSSEQFCKKMTKLRGKKCPNINSKVLQSRKILEELGYTKKWIDYELSNFEYLMELNNLAGRAYSDVTQFPVLPWVLINFSSVECNLQQKESIRNLELPMGALGTEERCHKFEERYEIMTMDSASNTKFHYGTHYSSPGITYHFLVRLSPFTEGSILLQSGKFDFADRLFFSMSDSYKNATTQYSDIRELLPQMYTIPEVYLNVNGLQLGVMQNKRRVHNVELPEWARENPYHYVAQMRKSLEESVANETLNHWFDLIFGYKQRGEQAVKSLNCFFYLTYEDAVDWHNLTDPKEEKAIESQILNFGQTPSQLFTKAHPERQSRTALKNGTLIVCDPGAEIKVYRHKGRDLLEQQIITNPMKQIEESIVCMKWIKESKMALLRRNGEILIYKWQANVISPTNRIPFLCSIERERKVERVKKSVFDPQEYYDLSLNISSFPAEFIGSHTLCLGGFPDGKFVVIEFDNEGSELYQGHSFTVCCLKTDPKENFLITGDISGGVIVWHIQASGYNCKLAKKHSFRDQKAQISSIFVSVQLGCIGISSLDGSVFMYNLISGKKMRVYYHPKGLPLNQVLITTSPLAAVLLFCNSEKLIYSYGINGQLIQRVVEKEAAYFLSPIIMKDINSFEYVAYGNERGEVIMRSLPFLENMKRFTVAKDACVNRVSISRNGRYLVAGCSDGEVSVITDPNLPR